MLKKKVKNVGAIVDAGSTSRDMAAEKSGGGEGGEGGGLGGGGVGGGVELPDFGGDGKTRKPPTAKGSIASFFQKQVVAKKDEKEKEERRSSGASEVVELLDSDSDDEGSQGSPGSTKGMFAPAPSVKFACSACTFEQTRPNPKKAKTMACSMCCTVNDLPRRRQDGAAEATAMSPPSRLGFRCSKNTSRFSIYEAASGASLGLNFSVDDAADTQELRKIMAGVPERLGGKKTGVEDTLKEVRGFLAQFNMLREISKKALKDKAIMVTADNVRLRAVEALEITVDKDRKVFERYVGGEGGGDDGGCKWCGAKEGTVQGASYCNQECFENSQIRGKGTWYQSTHIRAALFELERGVCVCCKIDAHGLFTRIKGLQPSERLNALLGSSFTLPKSSTAVRRLLSEPVETMFWEVSGGGGGQSARASGARGNERSAGERFIRTCSRSS